MRKYSDLILVSGFIFWFIETAYFGWNRKASCTAEEVADFIAMLTMILGFWFGYLSKPKIFNVEFNLNRKDTEELKKYINQQ